MVGCCVLFCVDVFWLLFGGLVWCVLLVVESAVVNCVLPVAAACCKLLFVGVRCCRLMCVVWCCCRFAV